MNWRGVAAYFLTPFPSTQGFSPYRMPGPSFHFAILIVALYVGITLCLPHRSTAPLLAIWVIGGLYLGRDLTIAAHYVPIVGCFPLLLLLAIPIGAAFFPETLKHLHEELSAAALKQPVLAWILTAIVAGAQTLMVVDAGRRDRW